MQLKLEAIPGFEPDQTSWQQEISACNNALVNADYNRACVLASEAIDKLFRTRYVKLLRIRAEAYGRQGYFDKGILDANRIIHHAPTLATGYLQAGKLYSMQGRHAAAIDIYTTGLERCVDCKSTDISNIKAMAQRRREAKRKLEVRIDFIAKLPIKILPNVLLWSTDWQETATTTPDMMTWMLVSKAWRQRIAECPQPWRRLVLRRPALDRAVYGIIPLVGSHVQSLISVSYTSYRILNHLKDGYFDNLCLLQLSFLGTKDSTTVDPEDLSIGLWQVRHTLTVLILQMGDSERVIPLSKLPRLLPNLSQLSYDTRRVTALLREPWIPVCDIKVLRLVSPDIHQQDIKVVLKSCPKLQQLFIYGLRDVSYIRRLKNMYSPLLKKCVIRSILP